LLSLKPQRQFHHQTQAGMIIKLKHAANKDLFKLATTVFNAMLQTSSMLLTKDANHVHSIIHSTTSQSNVTVKSHVNSQENWTPTTFVNALLMRKETEEYSTKWIKNAIAQPTSHSGTADTVLLVQLEQNTIQKNNNVTTAHKDS